MRPFIVLGLGICTAASASAQAEVIIRQPGHKDQVIELTDSSPRMRLKVDSVVGFAFNSQLRAQGMMLQDRARQLDQEIARVRIDTLMPAKVLALRAQDMAIAEQRLQSLNRNLLTKVRRQPHFGISVDYRSRDSDKWGAYVVAVTPGSPAERAGILSGDIITRIDGKSLTGKDASGTSDDDRSLPYVRLTTIISQLQVGKPVAVELRRGTQTHTVHVTPEDDSMTKLVAGANGVMELNQLSRMGAPVIAGDGDRREPFVRSVPGFSVFSGQGNFAYSYDAGGLFANLELAPVNEKLGEYFGVTEGILVVNTNATSAGWASFDSGPGDVVAVGSVRLQRDSVVSTAPGAHVDVVTRKAPQLDLQPGDVITAVDGRKVTTPSQLMRIVSTYDRGDEFKLQVMRQKHAESIPVKMP